MIETLSAWMAAHSATTLRVLSVGAAILVLIAYTSVHVCAGMLGRRTPLLGHLALILGALLVSVVPLIVIWASMDARYRGSARGGTRKELLECAIMFGLLLLFPVHRYLRFRSRRFPWEHESASEEQTQN